jgi:predicted nucleotidyltransferase
VNEEPRYAFDYSERQVKAAHRVLVDVGQVLASFTDAFVVVGGWVPDLLLPNAEEQHVGSIDVDLALNAEKLSDGRYGELLKLLLDTGRYTLGAKSFQLVTPVDLGDGEAVVRIDLEFLAPSEMRLDKNKTKLVEGFRVLQVEACSAAFVDPQVIEISDAMISGATNTVRMQVAALPDFVILKAHAIGGREKPKDAYDLCYCLDEAPGGVEFIASAWRQRRGDPLIETAIGILREKFASVDHYGPQQVATFHQSGSPDEGDRHARRAYELVRRLLHALG